MNAHAQEQVRMTGGESVRLRHDRRRIRDLDECGDAGRVRALDRILAVLVEPLVAQVAVSVDHVTIDYACEASTGSSMRGNRLFTSASGPSASGVAPNRGAAASPRVSPGAPGSRSVAHSSSLL